jgi:hypothetical protein
MADQLDPALAGTTDRNKLQQSERLAAFLEQCERQLDQRFDLITTSDRTCVDLR